MRLLFRFFLLVACFIALPAQAAITCSFQGIPTLDFVSYTAGTTYATSTNALRQVTVTALCTRASSTDATSVSLGIDAGANAQGQNPRMRLGTQNYYISYDTFMDSACSAELSDKNKNTRANAALASTTGVQQQVTFTFFGCIRTAQALAGYPSGMFTDTAAIRIRDNNTIVVASTMNVQVFAPALCTITNGPANIVFQYTAFGAADVRASSFNANCTNNLSYTVSVDPPLGVVGGLRYTLGLTALAPGSGSNVGMGSIQDVGNPAGTRVYYVNGFMPAAQPGASGAVTPQPHTTTITY